MHFGGVASLLWANDFILHYKKTAFLLLFLQKCVTSWKTSQVFQKHPTFARKRLLEDEISLNVTDNRTIKFREQVNVT